MNKNEILSNFLKVLSDGYHEATENFVILCGSCGSRDCEVIVIPDTWQDITQRGANGIKCLECGLTKVATYRGESLYG